MARSPKRRGARRPPASQRNKSIPTSTVPRAARAEHSGPRFAGAAGLAQRAAGAQWLALAGLYVASLVVYGLLSRQQSVPWLFPDEFIYGNVAQNIAHGAGANWRGEGQGVPLLYPMRALVPVSHRLGGRRLRLGQAARRRAELGGGRPRVAARPRAGRPPARARRGGVVDRRRVDELLGAAHLREPRAPAGAGLPGRDGDGAAAPRQPLDLGGDRLRGGGGLHARDPLRPGAGDPVRAVARRLAPARR